MSLGGEGEAYADMGRTEHTDRPQRVRESNPGPSGGEARTQTILLSCSPKVIYAYYKTKDQYLKVVST